MLFRALALLVAVAGLLPGCDSDESPQDNSYGRGEAWGEWQSVAVNQTRLGRTEAAVFATSALQLRRPSDSSEIVAGSNAFMMFDEAIPPYMLRRLRADEMAEAIQANYVGDVGRLTTAMESGQFRRGPSSFGTFYFMTLTHVGRACVAFVQHWPPRGRRSDRIQKRLLGVVCDSNVDNGDEDFVDYVTTSFVPAIVDEVK